MFFDGSPEVAPTAAVGAPDVIAAVIGEGARLDATSGEPHRHVDEPARSRSSTRPGRLVGQERPRLDRPELGISALLTQGRSGE